MIQLNTLDRSFIVFASSNLITKSNSLQYVQLLHGIKQCKLQSQPIKFKTYSTEMKFVVFLVCLVAMVSLVVARGDQIEDLIEGHLEELDRPGKVKYSVSTR